MGFSDLGPWDDAVPGAETWAFLERQAEMKCILGNELVITGTRRCVQSLKMGRKRQRKEGTFKRFPFFIAYSLSVHKQDSCPVKT